LSSIEHQNYIISHQFIALRKCNTDHRKVELSTTSDTGIGELWK